MIKQIPNIFTLINLLLGCLAITYLLNPGLIACYTNGGDILIADTNNLGTQYINVPQQIFMASLFIALAAVVDFLDGFVARMMNATSEMGKQLDSLSDLVSFGVAPGMIVFIFLKLSYAQQANGLDTSMFFLVPAFIIPCAGAYRLARFNTDTGQQYFFKGLPIPAAGLFIASFPLIYWTSATAWITRLLINEWFWYAIIIFISWLMVSKIPMLAPKFSSLSAKKLFPFIILVFSAAIGAFLIGWLVAPVVFVLYVLLSLLIKQNIS